MTNMFLIKQSSLQLMVQYPPQVIIKLKIIFKNSKTKVLAHHQKAKTNSL